MNASNAPAPGRALRSPPRARLTPRRPPDPDPLATARPPIAPPTGRGACLDPVPRAPHPAELCRRLPGLLLLVAVVIGAGCNEHPLMEVEQVLQGAARDTSELPARNRIDLLFVIDDSQSMCQEQASLAANFGRLADFFFERLGSAADLRIAVTTTDLAESDGRLLGDTPAGLGVTCDDADQTPLDCGDVAADPILSTGPEGNVGRGCAGLLGAEATACVRADLDRRFRCLARRGAGGGSKEKGLEAMRRALSCDGPNAARFGACCTPAGYDPRCAGEGPAPEFLRPDALLVVVFVSDEDDCSTPADNPALSRLAICRGGLADGDGDGLPDGFADRALCNGLGPAACLRTECGGLSPADCHATRCAVEGTDYSSCVWEREALTPVADYVGFLGRLKAEPADQLLVAAIVGERMYTADGFPVTFRPPDGNPACSPETLAEGPTDACCPGGVCRSEVLPACETAIGRADTGERYLQLAETIGSLGLDCVDEGTSLCEGDLVQPLEALSSCIEQSLVRFCLAKPVVEPTSVRVALDCLDDERCAEVMPPMAIPPTDFALAEDPGCTSGWALRLDDPPPAGARLTVDYLVAQ